MKPRNQERDAAIVARYREGATLHQLGAEYDLAWQRIHQIVLAEQRRSGVRILRYPARPSLPRCPHCGGIMREKGAAA